MRFVIRRELEKNNIYKFNKYKLSKHPAPLSCTECILEIILFIVHIVINLYLGLVLNEFLYAFNSLADSLAKNCKVVTEKEHSCMEYLVNKIS